jgi:hypothetical protein
LGAALISALFLASGDARRRWTMVFPAQRARSVNLVAKRGNPRVWLVAHLDSKSQTVPMLGRIAGSVALTVITVLALVVLLSSVFGDIDAEKPWRWIEVSAVIAALPVAFCWVGNKSAGAVDNATGVTAAVTAAKWFTGSDLGVLITSGEELGLAGARAWAHSIESHPLMLNCDTVDDAGHWRCMYTSSQPGRLLRAAENSARRLGLRLSIGRLIPGILADSVAFADKGVEAVTLSRGNLATLARIHTRGDNLAALSGAGVAEGARFLVAIAEELS